MNNSDKIKHIEARMDSYVAEQGGWVFVHDENVRNLYFAIQYAHDLEKYVQHLEQRLVHAGVELT